ncbi:Co-chaperone [Rhodotorula kratochvilovae]
MAQLSAGIKNWHWRTKGVEGWAKEWFSSNLTGVEADGVKIEEVTDVEGDCELGMRKGKLLTIYDTRISMRWAATDKAGEAVTGTLVAPEVAHDMDEDEYQFESTLAAGSGAEAEAFLRTAKRALADKLRPKFQQFPKDMLAVHGADLLADVEAPSSSTSGASTPAPSSAPTASSSATAASVSTSKPSAPAKLNTATVRATGEFQCDAETLFDFLTNAQKIPAWTRNPAQMAPEVGTDVALFGGNIRGKVESVERPKAFTMTWRAPTWPENHYGVLETTLNQGSNSTTLSLKLTGVPVGKEDETESNLHGYYIRGLQSIGLGLLSSSAPSSSSSAAPSAAARKAKRAPPAQSSLLNRWTLVNVGSFAASVGLLAAFGAALYFGPNGPGGKK